MEIAVLVAVELFLLLMSVVYAVVLFFSVLAFCLSYSLLLIFLPRKFLWKYWVRPWAWWCLRSCGQVIEIEGNQPSPKNGPYLYIFNHQSLFDAFLVGYGLKHRVTGLGASKYFYLPLWGQMMWLHGTISVNRQSHFQALNSVKEAEIAMRDGESMVVFPEGQRSVDGRLQEFKKGAFHLAREVKATIVPCVISGSYRSWTPHSWRIYAGTITLKFLAPIPYEEYQDVAGVDALANLVKSRIIEGLN